MPDLKGEAPADGSICRTIDLSGAGGKGKAAKGGSGWNYCPVGPECAENSYKARWFENHTWDFCTQSGFAAGAVPAVETA